MLEEQVCVFGDINAAWIGDNDPATREAAVQHDTAAEGSSDARATPDEMVSTPENSIPKFMTYEVLTARLRGDQIDFLSELERRIMRNRTTKGERITKNSLLRAAVDMLHMVQLDPREIADENELRQRVLSEIGST